MDSKDGQLDIFDNVSPLDYRYKDKDAVRYLTPKAELKYQLRVELALIKTFAKWGICQSAIVYEVEKAVSDITCEEVYAGEKISGHYINALRDAIRKRVSDQAKPYIHLAATSQDVLDTANVLRFRDFTRNILIPNLITLVETIGEIAQREAETIQVGRTHGQHAVPITFGFALAGCVSRLSGCILSISRAASALVGQFSGACGSYNALALLVSDPEKFEKEVLVELGIAPAEISTQVLPPEPLARMLHEIILAAGVIADLSDSMRQLARTEISEIGETADKNSVGSSTMPHKVNPKDFENIKSLWKTVISRIITINLDQISEHQRDLTNSASARTYPEIFAYVLAMTKRLKFALDKLAVNKSQMSQNLDLTKGGIIAEALYVLLAKYGHPDAHKKAQEIAKKAKDQDEWLNSAVASDRELDKYLNIMTQDEKNLILHPALFQKNYTGIAAKKAAGVLLPTPLAKRSQIQNKPTQLKR